jgi:hypothetical protein
LACGGGGLRVPTQPAFSVGIKAWVVYQIIDHSPLIRKQFLSEACGTNKKQVFAHIIKTLLQRDSAESGVVVTQVACAQGHDLCSGLASRQFSCMSSNTVKRLNQEAKDVKEQKRNRKRQLKLTSQNDK